MRIFFIIVFSLLFLPWNVLAAPDPIHANHALDEVVARTNQLFLDARFDEGIELLKNFEKTQKKGPAISFFLANGYWWKIFRSYVYDKDAKSTPFDKDFEFYIGETISRSEYLLKRNKNDIEALFYLGNAYSLKSRVKGLRGSYFSAGRDAARGKNFLERVIEQEPNQYDTYYNLGVYNYLAGALPGYAKVLKTLLFLPGGNKEKGLSLLKLAGQKSSYFNDEAQLLLARFYADFEEQPQEAVRIVRNYHDKFPRNAWYHYWMGTLYSDELNDYDTAETVYLEVLELCNQGADTYTAELKNQAWLKLARVHSRILHPEKAIEEIKSLLATRPKEPSWLQAKAHLDLGNVYDQIGMRKEALLSYKQVLSLKDHRDFHEQAEKLINQNYNQKNADIYRLNLEGRRLAARGEFEEARKSFEKVLVKYPNNDQTLYAMAEMYYLQSSYQKATEILNKVLARKPREPKWLVPGIYVRLGMIYEARKQANEAKRSYEKALDTDFIASDDRNIAKRALKQIAQARVIKGT